MSNNKSGLSLSDVLNCFPPGAEIVGITDGNGKEYNEDEIRAIESLEREQMKNTDMTPKPTFSERLRNSVQEITKEANKPGGVHKIEKEARKIEKLFMNNASLIAICNDKTCWLWEDNMWFQLQEAPKTQPIPQDD